MQQFCDSNFEMDKYLYYMYTETSLFTILHSLTPTIKILKIIYYSSDKTIIFSYSLATLHDLLLQINNKKIVFLFYVHNLFIKIQLIHLLQFFL